MRRTPGMGTNHAAPLNHWACYDTLQPGGQGLFLPVYYDRNPSPDDPLWPYLIWGSSTDVIDVYDPHFLNCVMGGGGASIGEVACITYDYYRRQYVVVGSQGLTRWAALSADLAPDGSAAAVITQLDKDDNTVATLNITVYGHAPGGGDDIPAGSDVIVNYDSQHRRWKCPVSYRNP